MRDKLIARGFEVRSPFRHLEISGNGTTMRLASPGTQYRDGVSGFACCR
jgi:hypothetical protein